LALRTIADHKGIEPVLLKVTEFCSFADFFIICSGGSRRQVEALAQHLEEALARAGVKPLGVEGVEEGQWVLLDYNDLVIHIFLEPLREFYNLEDLWSEAPKTLIETDHDALNPSISSPEPLDNSETDTKPIHHE
jgi:ribosome-associated protein